MLSQTDHLQGQAKADALVAGYAKHVGAGDAHLDADNDRSFGDFGFHYDPQEKELIARVYIVRADLDWGPAAVAAIRQVAQALNDPKIGGMFETAGGHFVLDEKKEAFFLVKSFAVDAITEKDFIARVDNLRSLAGFWLTRWMPHVADMAHGREAPPTHKITRENNPYPL